jgi:hypothetical protein
MPDSTFYTYLASLGLHKIIISSDHSSFEKNPYSQRHLFPYLLKFYFKIGIYFLYLIIYH